MSGETVDEVVQGLIKTRKALKELERGALLGESPLLHLTFLHLASHPHIFAPDRSGIL